jgi:hypothetical protein
MPSTDRKLELKAKTSVAQTGSQPYVYAKGLSGNSSWMPYAPQLIVKQLELKQSTFLGGFVRGKKSVAIGRKRETYERRTRLR